MAAYRWLVDNYKDGDRIFLFGTYVSPVVLSANRLTASRLFSWRLSSADHCGNDREGLLRLTSTLGSCTSETTRVGWIDT